jgi:hypothetical protein
MRGVSITAVGVQTSPGGVITPITGRSLTTITRGITRHGTGPRPRRTTITTPGITRHGTDTRHRRTTTTTRGTTPRDTGTRRRRIITTPGITRHGTDTTAMAARPITPDRTIAAGTTTVDRSATARAEGSSSDRVDALDVPHDPGALGLLRLHHACARWERHVAELA